MTHSLCSQALDIDREVREFLLEVNGLNEESVTDYLLWKWSELDSRMHRFSYKRFSRSEENLETGADFELWIIGKHYSLPLVVQAKKFLQKPYDSYRKKSGILTIPGNNIEI